MRDDGAAAVTANDVGRTGKGGRQVLPRMTVEAHDVSLPHFGLVAATSRDDVPAGGTTGVVARDNGLTTNEAPRAHEEASYGAAPGVTEWDGIGATVAYNAAVAGRDAASARYLIGWRRAMVGRLRMRPAACPSRLNHLYPAISSWLEQIEYR